MEIYSIFLLMSSISIFLGTSIKAATFSQARSNPVVSSSQKHHAHVHLDRVQSDHKKNGHDYGTIPLHEAAKKGNSKMVRELLDARVNLEQANTEGQTALHLASQKGHLAVVNLLLLRGADIYAVDSFSSTPLHYASLGGHVAIARKLLEKNHKASYDHNYLEMRNEYGQTVINLAAEKGHTALLSCLIENNADVNSAENDHVTVLHHVVKKNNLDAVTLLIKNGVRLDEQENILGNTPLHDAVKLGKPYTLVKELLDAGARKDLRNKDGMTALHYAALYSDIDCVQLFFDKESSKGKTSPQKALQALPPKSISSASIVGIDIENNVGQTALHCALENGNDSIVTCLIDAGAGLDEQDNEGNSPLHYAVRLNRYAVVSYLLKKGAKRDICNGQRKTILHTAAQNGSAGVLLEDPLCAKLITIQDKDMLTPLHTALFTNQDIGFIKKLVFFQGADLSLRDTAGRGVLHYAVQKNNVEAVYFIIKAFAEVDESDNEGYTPLLHAFRHSSFDICRFLVAKRADICAKANNRESMLHVVAYNTDPQVVRYCVELWKENNLDFELLDKLGRSPLEMAVRCSNKPLFDELLKQGLSLEKATPRGTSLFMIAAGASNLPELFPDKPIDDNGMTPLNHAVKAERLITGQNIRGEGAIHCAARYGQSENIDWLIHKCPDQRDRCDRLRNSPLHCAVSNNQHGAVKTLLDHRADVWLQDDNRMTALHHAVKIGSLELCSQLIESVAEADQNRFIMMEDKRAQPAYFEIKECNEQDAQRILEYMNKKGADFKNKNGAGKNLLYYLIKMQRRAVARYIIQNGLIDEHEFVEDGCRKLTLTHLAAGGLLSDPCAALELLCSRRLPEVLVDSSKRCPLYYGVNADKPEVCALLLKKGYRFSLSEDLFKQSNSQEVVSPFLRALQKNAITCMKLLITYGCQEFINPDEESRISDVVRKAACIERCWEFFQHYRNELLRIEGSAKECMNRADFEKTFGDCIILKRYQTVSSVDLLANSLLMKRH